MKKLFSTIGAVLVSSFSLFAAAEIGKPAPDFAAGDIQGRTQRFSDYKGKIIVLEAYNLDCPFCRHHYKTGAMQELQAELTAKGVVWFVVNSVNPKNPSHRSAEAAQKEWDTQKIKATAWLDDSSGQIGKASGMKTTPHLFVVAKDATIAYQGAIDDRPSTEGYPRTARNYVREAVNALLAGKQVSVAQTKPYGCGVKYGN